MAEKFISQNEDFALFKIDQANPSKEWINFRLISIRQINGRFRRGRLSYSRLQDRFSNGTDTMHWQKVNPESLNSALSLIRESIKNGLV